jgi:zinc transport system permease protein
VLVSRAPGGTPGNLTAYLFGAITTTSRADLVAFAVLTAAVLLISVGLSRVLFAVSNDEEYARAAGLPVTALNLLLAVMTAVTVVVSMRVVGLLLISALMIIPTAIAQLVARSFRATLLLAVAVGLMVSVGGVVTSFYADTPSGGTIVLLAVGLFAVASVASAIRTAVRGHRHQEAEEHVHHHDPACGHEMVPHEGHVDYVHDGHRHAAHGAHYDEH